MDNEFDEWPEDDPTCGECGSDYLNYCDCEVDRIKNENIKLGLGIAVLHIKDRICPTCARVVDLKPIHKDCIQLIEIKTELENRIKTLATRFT